MTPQERVLVDQEIEHMLKEGAIKVFQQDCSLFLSPIFAVPKKDSGHRPVINLKNLNHYIPYSHFKMEELFLLKQTLQEGDNMCKIDHKNAYFSVPLNQKSQKFVSFKWKDLFYQFLCLCFSLGPVPRIFTKLMIILIFLLRKLYVRLIIFEGDILLMAPSKEELTLARDTVVYLLQNLGFLINKKKSVLEPCQNIQFLGMEINSIEMTLTLAQEKKGKIAQQCQNLLGKSSDSIRELSRLIGRLASTAIAVLLAPLQYQAMQRHQILELQETRDYNSKITLSAEVKAALDWWVQNLHLTKGRSIISVSPQLIIASDASLKGWGGGGLFAKGTGLGDHGHC